MMKKKYSGVVVPAVTPLTQDYKLDEQSVEKLFQHFYNNDAAPFILGTTGEVSSLSLQLKKNYIKKAASLKKNNVLLYVGIASNCFEESLELSNVSAEVGADVAVVTIPSYYALTESQTKKYFEKLADVSLLPIIIYNIPATTHVSLPLALIDELSHHSNIVAIKDSERSDERLEQSLNLWKERKDFSHFVGWAARSAKALLNGSDGIIPSTGNVEASIYKKMANAVVENDAVTANAMQTISDELGSVYQSNKTLGESLWALKILMKHKSLCGEYVMPPLQSLSKEEAQNLIERFEIVMNKI